MLKNRTILALALLVVVAGATAWKVLRKDPHVKDLDAPQPLTIAKGDVDELEIAEPGKPAVVLKKEGSEWKMTAPVADRADQKAVEQAVEGLSQLRLRDVIAESPESYEKVGLKEGDAVKVVPKKAGKPLATLLVGKTSNVRLDGDPRVWSTSNLKRWSLVKEAKLWRDRQVLDFPVDQVETVEVAYPSGARVVARRETPPPPPPAAGKDAGAPPPPSAAGPDRWVLVEGQGQLGGPLDTNVPLELASSMARLTADDIVDDAKPETTGLAAPRATVTVKLKDGKTHTLLVGSAEAQTVYVQRKDGPRVWKIQKYEADRVPSSPAQWRDKTILRVEPAEVVKIELDRGDKDRTVLERVDDKSFKATLPAGFGELDQMRVSSMLRTTQGLRATSVVENADLKALGLDKPRATATLWKKQGPPVKLAFGTEKENNVPVQLSGQKDVYSVPAYLVQAFTQSTDQLKKKADSGAPASVHGGM